MTTLVISVFTAVVKWRVIAAHSPSADDRVKVQPEQAVLFGGFCLAARLIALPITAYRLRMGMIPNIEAHPDC